MMKYCPNTECSFFLEIGMVAEYQDDVDFCLDCKTRLEDGHAPFMMPPKGQQSLLNPERDADTALKLVTVDIVDSFADAIWVKEELEQAGISAVIVPHNQNELDGELNPDSTIFDVQVIDQQVIAAKDVLQYVFEDHDEPL
ncbi:MAG: hypothetical protein AAF639_09610, partial [Chloroflexota bacterium]